MISMFNLLQVCDFQSCVLCTEEGVSDCTRQLSKEPTRQGVRPAPMLDVSSRVSSPNMGAKFVLVDPSDRAAVPSVRSYVGLKQKLWHEQSTTPYWMSFCGVSSPNMEGAFILADPCDHLVIWTFDQVPMLDDSSLVSSPNMGAISILVEWLFGVFMPSAPNQAGLLYSFPSSSLTVEPFSAVVADRDCFGSHLSQFNWWTKSFPDFLVAPPWLLSSLQSNLFATGLSAISLSDQVGSANSMGVVLPV